MAIGSVLKKVGYFALFWIIVFVVLFLIAVLLRGMVWASEKILAWLINAARIAFDICVLLFEQLLLFRITRP